MERLWLWATSHPIEGKFRCGPCHVLSGDAYATPWGLMCSDCHRKLAERTTVKVAWNMATKSGSFTWTNLGGGKVTFSGDDQWEANGLKITTRDQFWGVAIYRWAAKQGYIGPNPFLREDWSVYAIPDNTTDPAELGDPNTVAA